MFIGSQKEQNLEPEKKAAIERRASAANMSLPLVKEFLEAYLRHQCIVHRRRVRAPENKFDLLRASQQSSHGRSRYNWADSTRAAEEGNQ